MRCLVLLAGLALFMGCNEDLSAGGSSSTCKAGTTKMCECSNGGQGEAECGTDGRYGTCGPCTDTGGAPAAGGMMPEPNTAPKVGMAMITPDPAREADTLTCAAEDVTDAEGDDTMLSYRWLVNDMGIEPTGSTLTTDHFGRGDRVVCEVIANDGQAQSEPVRSAELVISNTAPSIDSVTIEPAMPQMGATLTCAYGGYADDDGDADASTFEWLVGDEVVGDEAELVTDGAAGTVYTCRVTPRDDADAGEPKTAEVTIGNSAPSVSNVRIEPPMPRATDVLNCRHDDAVDADMGAMLTVNYSWAVNGEEVIDEVTDTLAVSHYKAGIT